MVSNMNLTRGLQERETEQQGKTRGKMMEEREDRKEKVNMHGDNGYKDVIIGAELKGVAM